MKEKQINDLLTQYLARSFIAIREEINSDLLRRICRRFNYTVLAGYYNEQLDTVLSILNKDHYHLGFQYAGQLQREYDRKAAKPIRK
jgi:hypothetical protein